MDTLPKIKRWCVFEDTPYYPAGGMGDFVGAFETEEEANLFVKRSVNKPYLYVEDILPYLTGESPFIPSEEEATAEKERKLKERQEAMEKSPLYRAAMELERRMINSSLENMELSTEEEKK